MSLGTVSLLINGLGRAGVRALVFATCFASEPEGCICVSCI